MSKGDQLVDEVTSPELLAAREQRLNHDMQASMIFDGEHAGWRYDRRTFSSPSSDDAPPPSPRPSGPLDDVWSDDDIAALTAIERRRWLASVESIRCGVEEEREVRRSLRRAKPLRRGLSPTEHGRIMREAARWKRYDNGRCCDASDAQLLSASAREVLGHLVEHVCWLTRERDTTVEALRQQPAGGSAPPKSRASHAQGGASAERHRESKQSLRIPRSVTLAKVLRHCHPDAGLCRRKDLISTGTEWRMGSEILQALRAFRMTGKRGREPATSFNACRR